MKRIDLSEEKYDVYILKSGLEIAIPRGLRIQESSYVEVDERLVTLCEAAWESSGPDDVPLTFRLSGPPGVGKNALVYHLAHLREQELFILQANDELQPEDVLVTPAMKPSGEVVYIGSPVIAAMLKGGILFIDEITKMRANTLSALASILDDRRAAHSALLGVWLAAEPDFRVCAAFNPSDPGAWDMPGWLKARTVPEFKLRRPDPQQCARIALAQSPGLQKWADEAQQLVAEREVTLDPRQMLQLVAYADRLDRRSHARGLALDPLATAFEHIVEAGSDADAKEE